MLVEWWLTDGEEPLPLPSTGGTNPTAPGALGSAALGTAQSLRCGSFGAYSTTLCFSWTFVQHSKCSLFHASCAATIQHDGGAVMAN